MQKRPFSIELRQFRQVFILGTLFVLIIFAFQNCGAPTSESDQLSSIAGSSPYPYKSKVDSLAYMSCQGMSGYDPNAFFTFRVAAQKSTSGFAIRQSFVSATGSSSPAQRAQIIKAHPLAAGSHLQLAVRSFADIQNTFRFGSSAQQNFDYANYPTSLSDDSIADALSGRIDGSFLNTFSPEIKMDLDFLSSSQSQLVREKFLSNEAFLAVSFAPIDSVKAIGVDGVSSKDFAHGQGLILEFKRANHITAGAETQVNRLYEFDMENRNLSAEWSCPDNLKFLIVRAEDRGIRTVCNVNLTGGDPVASADLTELRRFLPLSDWAVDMTNRCIVAKKSGLCYGTASSALPIRYPAASGSCDPNLNTCPHYVSVCKKL